MIKQEIFQKYLFILHKPISKILKNDNYVFCTETCFNMQINFIFKWFYWCLYFDLV